MNNWQEIMNLVFHCRVRKFITALRGTPDDGNRDVYGALGHVFFRIQAQVGTA